MTRAARDAWSTRCPSGVGVSIRAVMAAIEQPVGSGGEERAAGRSGRVARARELRERGWLLREIAAEMGVVAQTVFAWLDDPDGSKLRERKQRYGGVCVDCDERVRRACQGRRAVVCARSGGRASERGGRARALSRRSVSSSVATVTRRRPVIGTPIKRAGWGSTRARRALYADGCWPWSSIAVKVFGRWNDAIHAAGFAPTPSGRYDRERASPAASTRSSAQGSRITTRTRALALTARGPRATADVGPRRIVAVQTPASGRRGRARSGLDRIWRQRWTRAVSVALRTRRRRG